MATKPKRKFVSRTVTLRAPEYGSLDKGLCSQISRILETHTPEGYELENYKIIKTEGLEGIFLASFTLN